MKLFALNDKVLFYEQYSQYINVGLVYRNVPGKILKAIRRLHCGHRIPGYKIWFSREFRNCGITEKEIIIFDSPLNIAAAEYIHNKYPRLRIIYWFWNHIYHEKDILKLPNGIEKWSYDKEDCEKYKMKFNTQFYFNTFISQDIPIQKYDLYFVGKEKGRSQEISSMLNIAKIQGLTCNFHIIGNTRSDRIKGFKPYQEVVTEIYQSRCIVDFIPEAQKGMSLRPLEALFLKKKLITNWIGIKNEPFYTSKNIFIFGQDDNSKLKEFIHSPLEDNSSNRTYYDFKSWMKRFCE